MNNFKVGILIGGVVIAITVISITVLYPNYFDTFIYDIKEIDNNENNQNKVQKKAKESIGNLAEEKSEVNVLGPPLSTHTKGEEGNYDFIVSKVSQNRLINKSKGIITKTGQEETNNYLTTMALGEEGNPHSGPTTNAHGEEGNPAYPQVTANIPGAESTEFNNIIDHNHTYDWAGLGVY